MPIFEFEHFETDSLIEVEVGVTGRFIPETWGWDGGSPAEYPDWDIVEVHCDPDGPEVTEENLLLSLGMTQQEFDKEMEHRLNDYFVELEERRLDRSY